MICFVIDPDGEMNCYGKYERAESNVPDWNGIVEVEKSELDEYEVVEWRHESS